ncbi:hypothetical protein OTU49_008120 [Cherax quadricarinatus]
MLRMSTRRRRSCLGPYLCGVKQKDSEIGKIPQMAPSSQSTQPQAQQDKVSLKELKSKGKWAAWITIFSYVYGDLTVASQLPPDSRQDSWLLMKSSLPGLVVSLIYIAIVTWWGPLYMSNRQPVKGLKPIMISYNAFQVVFSAWIFYEGGMSGWFGSYKLVCQTCDFSDNPQAIRMLNIAYWYYISKFIDFIDTLFFVMHKKYEHISVLHVCHHALMATSLWFGLRYQPGGHITLMGFLNSFVHTVMYLYYLLAALGPRVRPYLWWKKYLTTLQMVQFTLIFFHALLPAFVECEIPTAFFRWLCVVAAMFFVLFSNFYIKAYRRHRKEQEEISTEVTKHLTKMCFIGAPLPNSVHSGGVDNMAGAVPKKMPNDDVEDSMGTGASKDAPNLRLRSGVGQ